MRKTLIPRREYDQTLLLYPNGYVEISPQDAQKLKVRDKWMVQLTSSTGTSMRIAVKVSPNVQPGTAYIPYDTVAFVCGPPVMFNAVIAQLLKRRMREDDIISTLERQMKCGIGKCQHCATGRTLVCTDGPVYTYHQIKTLGEVI